MDNFTIVNKTIFCCAKRNSGKSVLVRDLIRDEKSKFETIFLISPTEEVNEDFDEVIERQNVFSVYNDEWCGLLVKKMTETNKKKETLQRKHILIVFDDCISDVDFHHRNKNIEKIFTRGRHINIKDLVAL